MNKFIEKRKFDRVVKKIPLVANLFHKGSLSSSYDIPVTSSDISRGGMKVLWPAGWACSECKNCLFWIFNASCSLKENNHNSDFNKPLAIGCRLAFSSAGLAAREIQAEVIWLNWNEGLCGYDLGLKFLEEQNSLPF
ncbi:MAG: hypothetical protein PHQ96_09725 [Candidatus Omnitrophica bacterium]|nr:hypothetical protein [Candidatus Omnitrophota bacterium]